MEYYSSKDTVASDADFQKGLSLHNWNHYQVCYFYATVLHKRHRDKEATDLLLTALQEYPNYPVASDLLKEISSNKTITSTDATPPVKSPSSESTYINQSLAYFNSGEYQKCIEACNKIIALDPNSAVAYSNMCAAYNDLHQWDDAIKAGTKALQINPDFTLAKNNLNYAISQKKK